MPCFPQPTPTLIIHGTTDGYCRPEAAKAFYQTLNSPKDYREIETTNHIDLYD